MRGAMSDSIVTFILLVIAGIIWMRVEEREHREVVQRLDKLQEKLEQIEKQLDSRDVIESREAQ
jgi:uncharacterized membrane-anchored protein YhcB (DUF1043 family)